jgi:FMN phosphatase YigB (HAD superfamily)
MLGKPSPVIYDAAMQLLDVSDPKQVVAIGDSLMHDIAGQRLCKLQLLPSFLANVK